MKITLALTLLTLSTGWVAAQDTMSDTLRKAVVEQDSQHDLTAAVRDYQAVVAQFDEGRKTAATALFRLAECYRQQGKNDQAKSAYQRVVQEFADQSKLAAQSRTVLASTYKVQSKTEAGPVAVMDPEGEKARQRYRELLQEEIALAASEFQHAQDLVGLGTIPLEGTNPSREKMLHLQRELAAFDMGIVPAEIKAAK